MKKIVIVTSVIILLSVGAGLYFYYGKNSTKVNQDNPKEDFARVDELRHPLIDELVSQIPDDYFIFDTGYSESFESESVKAIGVVPCISSEAPVDSPLCNTSLVIWEEKIPAQSFDTYISNGILGWYEKAHAEKVVRSAYRNTVEIAYTPTYFMCLGTGGDGCSRKRFSYQVAVNSIINAEISFYPYENGERITEDSELMKEIQGITEEYTRILTGESKMKKKQLSDVDVLPNLRYAIPYDPAQCAHGDAPLVPKNDEYTDWKKLRTANFEIYYPSQLTPVESVESDEFAQFYSSNKEVVFSVYSPLWSGEPKNILVQQNEKVIYEKEIEKKMTCVTELGAGSTQKVTWSVIEALDASYRRSVLDIQLEGRDGSKTRKTFGIQFNHTDVLNEYMFKFEPFVQSLVQFGD